MKNKNKNKCLCCGNERELIVGTFNKRSSMSYPKAFDDLHIITCPQCEFSFTDKPISKKVLDFYYQNLYTGTSIKSNVWSPYYVRSRFQYSDRSLAQITLLSQFITLNNKNILEIGSATGDLQIDMANRGYKINSYIVEPQTINSNWFNRNNITPINVDVTDSNCFSQHDIKFDLVIMSHSLEHFNAESIDNIFTNIYSILNDDGVFFVEVPNANLYLFDGDVERMAPHLSFFSERSLSLFMEKHGFSILYMGLFGNSQFKNLKDNEKSDNAAFNEFFLDDTGQVKINKKTYSFDNKKSIKHIVFNIASKLLILGGLGALIVKVKTLMAISDKKFLNFNNKEMILNNVDGEFLRIIGKKKE
jgi:2-polyprenyl-3-methyl-5-hydroxy-6-metoxy-1,4-benzoquinol methylase